MKFSQLLYFHRSRLGLSQLAVAKMLEVPLRTFWAWESGANTPNVITQRVAVALLEDMRTDFSPKKVKKVRPPNHEVVVLNAV